jgi:hypothetical protein
LRDTDPHGLDMLQEGARGGSSSFRLDARGRTRRCSRRRM